MVFNDHLTTSLYHVERVNSWIYLSAVVFGKSRPVTMIRLSGKKEGQVFEHELSGHFIATISKKCLILTDEVHGKRRPVILRQWHREPPFVLGGMKANDSYEDRDGNKWTLTSKQMGNALSATIDGVHIGIFLA